MCVCVCVYSHPQMQYSFIYQALLEYYLYGDTELDVSSLEGHLHKLHNTFANGDRVGLEEEFKVRPYNIKKSSILVSINKYRQTFPITYTITFIYYNFP